MPEQLRSEGVDNTNLQSENERLQQELEESTKQCNTFRKIINHANERGREVPIEEILRMYAQLSTQMDSIVKKYYDINIEEQAVPEMPQGASLIQREYLEACSRGYNVYQLRWGSVPMVSSCSTRQFYRSHTLGWKTWEETR
jgi:hypothetical protein